MISRLSENPPYRVRKNMQINSQSGHNPLSRGSAVSHWLKQGILVSLILIMAAHLSITDAAEKPGRFLKNLQAYKTNYFLNNWFLDHEGSDQGYQNQEMIIQLSVKMQILDPFYFGYTHRAFWQVFDLDNSRPFREQNYNPELFMDLGQFDRLDQLRIGIWEHESNGEQMRFDQNGKPVNYSRTWDRTYLFARKVLTENLSLSAKVWILVSPKTNEYRAFYDDNSDLLDYMGNSELYLDLEQSNFSSHLMFRRGWKAGTETLQLDIRFPIQLVTDQYSGNGAFHIQAFSGYGDSLIDYNRKVTRIAAGISFR